MAPGDQPIPVDAYVLDVLLRDCVGHDHQPAAFLVYLFLYGRAERSGWEPAPWSLRALADQTGLSKSAVQAGLANLHGRGLVESTRLSPTATPLRQVRRPWAARKAP